MSFIRSFVLPASAIVTAALAGGAAQDALATAGLDPSGGEWALGGPDPCLDGCLLYSGDGSGNLYSIDPDAATSTFIGNMGVVMFDMAATTDFRLLGLSGNTIYEVSACNAVATPVGTATFGNGMTGDVDSDDLFVQGPPLSRVDMPSFTTTTVGGSFGADPPFWCGTSSGDLSQSPFDGLLYTSLICPECSGGDRLVIVDPLSGGALLEVGCFRDSVTLANLGGVFGLAHDCECRLWAALSFGNTLYLVDPATALATPVMIGGGFFGTFGMAAVPPVDCGGGNAPPTCEATAETPVCWTAQLHAVASDPDGDPLTYAWSTTDCPDAVFVPGSDETDPLVVVDPGCRTCTFDLLVEDGVGGTCTDSVSVVFDDSTPPMLVSCPADVLASCAAVPVAAVVTATDDCDPNPTLEFGEVRTDGPCPDTYVLTRTWTATDLCGNQTSCVQVVSVEDTTPPIVDATTLVSCLWSPNHQFVDVGLTATTTDDCTPNGVVTLAVTSVTSDEATGTELGAGGAHRHCPDAEVDGMSLGLRSERSGLGDGRVYRITVMAVDACGNAGEVTTTVTVPHDQSPKTPGQTNGNDPGGPCPAGDGGAVFDATACN